MLDKLADAGVLLLVFTGGEPLLHPEFQSICRHALRRGFLVTVYTNATLIDEAWAGFFAAHPPRRFEVSLYGMTPETTERVTGSATACERALAGAERLLSHGLNVQFKTLVTRHNLHEFEILRDWVRQRNRPFRFDTIINARLDGDPCPLAERVPAETLAAFHARWRTVGDAMPHLPDDDRLFRCGAGTQTFHIDPSGLIHPCMLWRFDPEDFTAASIPAWQARMRQLRTRCLPADSPCRACAARSRCANCPALSRLETGRAGAAVGYLCEEYRKTTAGK
jgi:radical SAM protein with 4Fe4S-binding SPASM domain